MCLLTQISTQIGILILLRHSVILYPTMQQDPCSEENINCAFLLTLLTAGKENVGKYFMQTGRNACVL